MKLKSIFLFFFLLFIASAYSQLSKKHYIPPLTSSDGFTDQYIYISTPKTTNISYKITPVGNPDIPEYSGVVSNGNPVVQNVLTSDGQFADFDLDSQLHIPSFDISGKISNRGFIIEADDEIYVSIRVRSSFVNGGQRFQAGALVSKGIAGKGTDFRVGGFVRDGVVTFDLSFASIMATEDDTNIVISDIPAGTNIVGYTGSFPITVNLNKGESYIVATAFDQTNNLIGTNIKSDKEIVVNSGSATGSFGDRNNNLDYGFDQIVGADKIGNKYITVRGDGEDPIENVLIIPNEDNTDISVNGTKITTSPLSAGEYYVLEGNLYNNNGNMYIETTKDVFVYQGVGGLNDAGNPSQANQGMFFVPPLSCQNQGDVNEIVNIDRIGGESFPGGVTIVTNRDADVTINEQDISTFLTQGPFSVDGTNEYVTYRVTGLTGNVKVKSNRELYCAYFNANGAATSGAFYSGFPSPPEIEFNTTIATLGNCVPNVTLITEENDLFDFQWEYFNESTSSWDLKSNSRTYKPIVDEPGRYRLIATIKCTGEQLEPVEIPVSLCPDDFDNDLIIDNLDVDLDNDGILNCDESLGDVNIDLSNTDTPIATNPNNGANLINSIKKEFTINSSTVIGTNMGDFTSTLTPDSGDSNLLYELNFDQNVNIKFTQSSTSTIGEDVFYILKIGPSSKNLTLIDPDNQILVDTNFDNIINNDDEQSIQYSASEIRFQINPSFASGNSTYQFFANQVNQISFEMRSNGLANAATYGGNIQLTCFSRDSDGDGIEDALDLDSDNDGVPDFFESVAQNITLLGTDANLDGLDDIFETVTPNQDTDGDGIPNYIDLDSDNDGIYDLVESGLNLIDADANGIIDNVNSSVGINGLFDTVETTADSGVLASALRNSDESSIVIANRDNLFDFVDLDADGDNCFDVVEAGFTGNGSGILFANPFAVDSNGVVINNTDGYTPPNADYITSAPIVVNSFTDVTFCEAGTDTISIDSTADTFQWQLSTDNGTNWINLVDDTVYNGVSTKDLQISNIPASFNNNQYRVLLNRSGYACADEPSNAIVLTINPLPVIKNDPAELDQCIDVNDLNPTVNLTTAESNISDNPGGTFQYYTDSNATNQITNETSYPVTVNTTNTVYVRVISDQGCFGDLVELRINVGQTPDNPYNDIQPPVCDDLLDANGNDTPGMNDDTDNITNFSLDRTAIINAINPPANTEVFFYENSSDRNNNLDEIDVTNYRNNINKIDITNIPEGIRFPIYYKIVSTINNDCQGLGEFFLEIHSVPVANVVADNIEECDDALSGSTTDGRVSNINLRDKVPEILGTQSSTDYTVTFHKSPLGATDGVTDLITNDTNYTNDAPNGFVAGTVSEQTIYVRVVNNTNPPGCYNANTSFKIIVQPIPTVPANVPDLIACDVVTTSDADPRNRVAQNIDLTARTTDILNGRTGLTVEYYITQLDAQNRTNVISRPEEFESSDDPTIANFPTAAEMSGTDKPAIQTIFFIVVDENGLRCPSNFSTFRLFIHPEPFVDPISKLTDCDNDNDGDDTNGIIEDIDLNGKIADILGPNRSVNDYTVTFHSTPNDAQLGSSALPSPYENSKRTETIYVRVQNNASLCVNTTQSFELEIHSLPDFSVTSPQILCLNDLPLTISAENPGNVYSYEWRDLSNNLLGTNESLDVRAAGVYKVIATDNVTSCQREENITVNESNIATLDASFVTIVDESNNLGSQNNLSIAIDTINNDLGPGDYQFAIINTTSDNPTNNRIPFIGFQDEPLFENLEGGIYQIIVNDKNGCSPDTTLLVSVLQFPKFFTPNGDGQNDTWIIKGADKTFYPNSSINIFNRFGKLVAQIQIDGPGWDGTYNGTRLPSDDYWYNITLVPSDNTKPTINKKGNFSLLRR